MNICVYGASSDRIDGKYIEMTEKLGAAMGKRGHNLVFGGGAHGLMGAVARGVYAAGGKVIGVAPAFFDVEGVLFAHCSEFIVPETMRERKRIMEERSDALVMTPGGIGTFDEFFEILTLKQLGRHTKPIAIYNIGGYFDKLLMMLRHAVAEGFVKERTFDLFDVFDDPEVLLDSLENYTPPEELSFLEMKY